MYKKLLFFVHMITLGLSPSIIGMNDTNGMIPIKNWFDLKAFSGKPVVYTTDDKNFSIGWVSENSCSLTQNTKDNPDITTQSFGYKFIKDDPNGRPIEIFFDQGSLPPNMRMRFLVTNKEWLNLACLIQSGRLKRIFPWISLNNKTWQYITKTETIKCLKYEYLKEYYENMSNELQPEKHVLGGMKEFFDLSFRFYFFVKDK